MKTILHFTTTALMLCGSHAWSQTGTYTNFIRQVQFPGPLERDTSCDTAGQRLSELAIDPGGARFELHTVTTIGASLVDTLLASCYVGASIPASTMAIRTEDSTGTVPRTRADRPFYVDFSVTELLSGPTDPDASKRVNLLRHVQSYGVGGTGGNIDRTAAILLSQREINTNIVSETLTYTLNSIPGADRSKVRGEERFSVFTVADQQVSAGGITYTVAASQIASQTVQIWPVADGSITGITSNQFIRFSLPALTLALNDLYPNSTTYAQVYKGNAQLGMTGKVVPGSGLVINESSPQSRVLSLTNYDTVFDSDGRWTMELVTVTPFGIDRLSFVTFDLDRTIEMNATFTTIE
jgi:hypothetical protein